MRHSIKYIVRSYLRYVPLTPRKVYSLGYTKATRQPWKAVTRLQESPLVAFAVSDRDAAVYQLVRVRARLAQLSSSQAAER